MSEPLLKEGPKPEGLPCLPRIVLAGAVLLLIGLVIL